MEEEIEEEEIEEEERGGERRRERRHNPNPLFSLPRNTPRKLALLKWL